MSEHFIRNIEIKKFKCFEDFKAEGFGRVNLIGGKNNVGKTAFMEAIYISSSKNNIEKIITRRYIADILWDLWNEIGKKFVNNFIKEKKKDYEDIEMKSDLNDLKVDIEFKSSNKAHKKNYEKLYSKIIEYDLEDRLDDYLNDFDSSIEKFRLINSQPHCKKNGKFYNLNEFGDGLGKFVYFIMLLLSNQNSIILIDEIENGIHYTQLDRLWEIILTLSKEQNVQVFATTHSKECIEAFNRVQMKLEDKDTYYFEMAKNIKTDEIFMTQIDSEMLEYGLSHNERIRGE